MLPRASLDVTGVTEQAQEVGCSRQSVAHDHAGKVKAAVEAEHGGGPTRAELVQENEACRQENIQLWNWLFDTIELPLGKLQEFAAFAAMGLATAKSALYWRFSKERRHLPVVPTIHRWSKPRESPQVRFLTNWIVLPDVGAGGLSRRDLLPPPTSLGGDRTLTAAVVSGEKADNHQGSTWSGELQPWTSLLCDIRRGYGAQGGNRPDATAPTPTQPSSSGKRAGRLHTKREGRRV